MLSICGLICTECPAYQAAVTDDPELRATTARQWSDLLGMDLSPRDIICGGCTSGNRPLFRVCESCEVRVCGRERGVLNCFVCPDYPCDKTERLHQVLASIQEPPTPISPQGPGPDPELE